MHYFRCCENSYAGAAYRCQVRSERCLVSKVPGSIGVAVAQIVDGIASRSSLAPDAIVAGPIEPDLMPLPLVRSSLITFICLFLQSRSGIMPTAIFPVMLSRCRMAPPDLLA
jgi:hypothetical protein